MNRNRLVMIGCTALVMAGVVSFMAYRILNAAIASANSPKSTAVVAAFDLSVGSVITARDIKVVRFPGGDIPDGHFQTPEEVIGRGVLTAMARNEIVLSSKLAPDKAGGGLPAMIPQGMRAVAVKVNDVISVAGFALPGTKVDVVLTGNATRNNDPGDVSATTVLQNVQVLAAGQKLQTNADGKPETVQVITLLVSPAEAQKLALATQEGRIQLSLRNPLDADASDVTVLRNATLYGAPAVTPHAKPRPQAKVVVAETIPTYTVETIKGNKRDTTTFTASGNPSTGDKK
jgi:pilus assembly protein CpaB